MQEAGQGTFEGVLCFFCNERGHRNCMEEVDEDNVKIFLRDNQDPAKEAGKAVQDLKLVAMVCKICDEHYGRFHRLNFKVTQMLRTLKPDDTESDSNPVACVAIKADGTSEPKKRKRSTDEEGKKDDE